MRNKIEKKVVFKLLKHIPKGKVVRYKDIAIKLGNPKAARRVGNILKSNKDIIKIPCHRVVKSDGEIGGYNQGLEKKKRLLEAECISIIKYKIKDLSKYLYSL